MRSGKAWGDGTSILFDLHKAVPARPSGVSLSMSEKEECSRAAVQDRAGGGDPEDPWLVGRTCLA